MNDCNAIIFDFFGTLVPNFSLIEHRAVLHEMAGILKVPEMDFANQWLATFTERATAVFPTVESNIRAVCQRLGCNLTAGACDEAVALRMAFERKNIIPRSSALDVLRELKRRQFKLGLITDCSSELPMIWPETPFAESFDVTIFSCKVGVRKPGAAIYLKACTQLGIAPEECVYVGDGGSKELSGAKAVGMNPVQLFVAEEQSNFDIHRIDDEQWTGLKISSLSEILDLLPQHPKNTTP